MSASVQSELELDSSSCQVSSASSFVSCAGGLGLNKRVAAMSHGSGTGNPPALIIFVPGSDFLQFSVNPSGVCLTTMIEDAAEGVAERRSQVWEPK